MRPAAILTVLVMGLSTLGAAQAFAQRSPDDEAAFERALELMGDDPAGARRLIEPLADKGDAESLNFLAILVQNDGPDWDADPQLASELREAALSAGSRAAALNIAIGLLMTSDADHARAIELLTFAEIEEQLKSVTAYPWGRAYLFGWGVERDMAKGVAYLEAYADGRDSIDDTIVDAHFLVARAYRNGWDVPVDVDRAYRHFSIAAELGDSRAQWNLAMMLLQGAGAPKNDVEAYAWVTKSSENGYAEGMVSRAVMLATGEGVEEDDEAAREWYFNAATLGSAHALRGLGFMLLTGEGGDVDQEMGFAFLELAAEAGEENAQRLLEMVLAQNTPPDRADIDAVRERWIAEFGAPEPVN
ncbi:MAG: tetratricopeptide repeat protein [Hyphomonadaceae bacterium]